MKIRKNLLARLLFDLNQILFILFSLVCPHIFEQDKQHYPNIQFIENP